MNINVLIEASQNAEHCQRNWNHTQPVPEEHVHALIDIATNMPTKSNDEFYRLVVSTDRDLNRKFYELAVDPDNEQTIGRNAQVDAPVVFTWFELKKEGIGDWKNTQGFFDPWLLNARTAMGISSGAVAFAANAMGYRTGYNQCFDSKDIAELVTEVTGETDVDLFSKPHYQLGIGFPNKEHPWNTVLNDDGTVFRNIISHNKSIKTYVI